MEEINFLTLQLAKKYTDEHGGGGGGTSNYNDLSNRPQINSTTLEGNMSYADLGIASAADLSSLSGDVSAIKDGQTIDSFGDVESALANKVDKVQGKGLSTNDYTDADKAIVGGVTAALADKADKSAVKNEFIGTTAEWNALTTAQKKAYDTYQITDDYTAGGGGLPDYSTTEQLTGQKWIDGKDVYFIVIELQSAVTLNPNQWANLGVNIPINTGISAVAIAADGTCVPVCIAYDASIGVQALNMRTAAIPFTKFVIYYTKTV